MRRPEATDRYAAMTENELKQLVVALARKSGWAVYHVPQARIPNGGGRGYPDLTLARDGEHLWLELKQEHMAPSIEQLAWGIAIGGRWCVIKPSDWYSGRVAELLG
jgi:hypothetical protein